MATSSEGIILAAAGVIMVAVFVWSWIGQGRMARWWVAAFLGPHVAMGVLPGLGLALIPAGMSMSLGADALDYAGWLMFPAFAVFWIGLIYPRLWAPGWYKRLLKKSMHGEAQMTGGTDLTSHYHRREAFWLRLPPDWQVREDLDETTPLVGIEPSDDHRHDGAFRANVVVTAGDVPDGLSFDDWLHLNDVANAQKLADYFLLDAEIYQQHGRAMHRRMAHHTVENQTAVTIQQWSTMRGRRGYTLTASSQTLNLQNMAALFNVIANEFTIDDTARSA